MLVPPLLGHTLDGDFVVAEWSDPGCPAEGPMWVAPLHLHRSCDEAWYVLEGTLCVLRDEEEVLVPSGAGVLVPKGTPHTYWNPEPKPCRYLLVMTSKTRNLIEAIHQAEDRSAPAMERLFERFDAVLLKPW